MSMSDRIADGMMEGCLRITKALAPLIACKDEAEWKKLIDEAAELAADCIRDMMNEAVPAISIGLKTFETTGSINQARAASTAFMAIKDAAESRE